MQPYLQFMSKINGIVAISTDKIQFLLKPARKYCKSLQIEHSPHFRLFDLAESFLLLQPLVSLGSLEILPLSICHSLPSHEGRFLSTSLSPFLSSLITLSLLHSLRPYRLFCYLPAGSILRCTAVGLGEDPGWMSHPLTICCPKALQASVTSRDPTAVHGHAGMYIYRHSHACLHIVYRFLRKYKLEIPSASTSVHLHT